MIKVDKWTKEHGVKFLKEVGIKKGDIIFDCCCGEGNYTIPAARIAGKNGTVYAMDMNKNKLDTLKEKFNSENLINIKIIKTEFKKSIPLADKSIDMVLLYDIFWYFSIEDIRLSVLLDEVYRTLKDNGLISVYPEHVDINKLKQKIINSNFILERELFNTIIHDNNLQKRHIWNFRKVLK
ncbi:2-methoxy-6-polyprenyl-1,4-benzoquinol methylase [subsurface metagenome]|jgi:ubiquinone/menaquinone biosynthesis C-methylase UbiE